MVRSITRIGLLAALTTVVAACGDDGTTSGTSTTEGGGGSGGNTTTTSSSGGGGSGGTTTVGGGGSGGTTTVGGGGSGGTTTVGGGGSGGSTTTTGGTGGVGGSTTTTGGMGGTGGMTTTTGGMGGTGGSDQITTVRATMDGGGLDLPIKGAFVTYVKPLLGMDAAGFFVQAEAAGPAIFVAVDPASLVPVPQVGDQMDFNVTSVLTTGGLKEVTGITGAMVMSSGNPIDPLVTDVNAAMDLVSNLAAYESRVIRITGSIGADFVPASNPQVASKITTAGLDDANLRIRMPEAIRAQYDLEAGCAVSVDYGVMWRFNAIAQPSVYAATDLTGITCLAPTVVSAVPLSPTEVVVNFDRKLDPATVDAADFTFDQGLMATAVAVNGSAVTVTTTPDVAGLTYTVTVAGLTDVLGAAVGMPNTAMFQSYAPSAVLSFNEINPNIGGGRDLIELVVTAAGSTNGIKLQQKGSVIETLATLPDVAVAVGDIVVVHLTPVGATGTAPGSETLAKNQYANGMFSANYDGAWDFHGEAVGLTFSNRVLAVLGPAGNVVEALPVVLSNVATPPAAYPGQLQAIQAAALWLPADCGGALCTYASTPTAIAVGVDYLGCGNSPTTASIQRKPGMSTKQNTDWNAAAAQSFGLANP